MAKDNDARIWVTTWKQFADAAPPFDAVIWSGEPYGFGGFGIEAAIKCSYRGRAPEIRYAEKPALPPDHTRVAFLSWNAARHQLDIAEYLPQTPDASYIEAVKSTPVWQLGGGWSGPDGEFRWIAPDATARLARPENAARFELRVLANTSLLDAVGPVSVRVALDDRELEPRTVTKPGWQVLQWDLAKAPAGPLRLSIHTGPPFKPPADPRILGIAIGGFGFR